jgi:hypothetical protein
VKHVAIRNSYGFRGRYWTEGETVDATDAEVKDAKDNEDHPLSKHFKAVGKAQDEGAGNAGSSSGSGTKSGKSKS